LRWNRQIKDIKNQMQCQSKKDELGNQLACVSNVFVDPGQRFSSWQVRRKFKQRPKETKRR